MILKLLLLFLAITSIYIHILLSAKWQQYNINVARVLEIKYTNNETKHEDVFKINYSISCPMYIHATFWSVQGYYNGFEHAFKNIMGLNNQKASMIGLLLRIEKFRSKKRKKQRNKPSIIVLPECEISYPECQPFFQFELDMNNTNKSLEKYQICNVTRSYTNFQNVYDLNVWETTLRGASYNFTFWSLDKFYHIYNVCNYSRYQMKLLSFGTLYQKYEKSRTQSEGTNKLMLTGLSALRPHQNVLNKVDQLIHEMTYPDYPYYFALQARIERDIKISRFHGEFPQFRLSSILQMINNTFPWEQLISSKYFFIAVGSDIEDEDKQVIENKLTPWNAIIVVSNEIAIKNNYSYQVNAMFDYEICLKAKLFIGTYGSSFSNSIAVHRNYQLTFNYAYGKIQTWSKPKTFSQFNASLFRRSFNQYYSFPYV